MEWLLWLLIYPAVALPAWVIMGRIAYRSFARDSDFCLNGAINESGTHFYYGTLEYRREELEKLSEETRERIERIRLEMCRKEAVSDGAAAFLWPIIAVVLPFFGLWKAVQWMITAGVDKELEREKEFKKAQKIVDEWNAKKKAEEDEAWSEVMNG